MGHLFGTDGVRGLANSSLTAELALDLSVAAAHVLGEAGAFRLSEGHRPVAVVGRDTRISGCSACSRPPASRTSPTR
jgi:phosphoglucosamine mutase